MKTKKENMTMNHYRQGDVLIIGIAAIPKDAKCQKRDGRIVLAHGDVTGHAHAIHDTHVKLLQRGDQVFLRIDGKPAELRHEEHSTIALPPGKYEVRRQREYHPSEIRRVED